MPTINRPPRKKRDTERQKEKHKLYASKEWQALRLLKLQEHPMCQRCGKELATCVHHIIPFMQFSTPEERKLHAIYIDLSDLMSLCEKCHEEIHKELKEQRKIINN